MGLSARILGKYATQHSLMVVFQDGVNRWANVCLDLPRRPMAEFMGAVWDIHEQLMAISEKYAGVKIMIAGYCTVDNSEGHRPR